MIIIFICAYLTCVVIAVQRWRRDHELRLIDLVLCIGLFWLAAPFFIIEWVLLKTVARFINWDTVVLEKIRKDKHGR